MTHLWLMPYERLKSPQGSSTSFLPLFSRSRRKVEEGEKKDFWLLPFARGTAPGESYHGVLPFYFSSSDQDHLHKTFNLLWPLFRREVTKSPSGEVLEYKRRFLIFSESKDEDGTRVFRLLGIPIVERTK